MSERLAGKVALVSGGARGMGAAHVREMIAEGARVVASDGYRVAIRDFPASGDGRNLIIPARSVDELIRVLKDGEARFTYGDGQLSVTTDRVHMNLKLLDGDFPDYERVIPENGDKHVLADREQLRKALARTAILSNEKFRGVRLLLEEGTLKLQTHNPEHEEAEEEVEVNYSGPSIEIGFNVNYLMDALGVMHSEQVALELKNAESSGLLHEAEDRSSKYVIMPMRL